DIPVGGRIDSRIGQVVDVQASGPVRRSTDLGEQCFGQVQPVVLDGEHEIAIRTEYGRGYRAFGEPCEKALDRWLHNWDPALCLPEDITQARPQSLSHMVVDRH